MEVEERASHQLLDLELDGGWKVIEKCTTHPAHTGGFFSVPYIVENSSGERAFLKALDFSDALQSTDVASALQAMTSRYIFERDLVFLCAKKRMKRVVTAIAHGSVNVGDGLANT